MPPTKAAFGGCVELTIIAVVRELPVAVLASAGWRVGEPTDVPSLVGTLDVDESARDDAGEATTVDANVLVVATTVVDIDVLVDTTALLAVVVAVNERSFAHTTHFGLAAKVSRLKQGMSATIGQPASPQR